MTSSTVVVTAGASSDRLYLLIHVGVGVGVGAFLNHTDSSRTRQLSMSFDSVKKQWVENEE